MVRVIGDINLHMKRRLEADGHEVLSSAQYQHRLIEREKEVKRMENSKKASERMKKTQAEMKKTRPPSKIAKMVELLLKAPHTAEELVTKTGVALSTTRVQLGYHLPRQGYKVTKSDKLGKLAYQVKK